MRIVICTMQVPFLRGGTEFLVESLKQELLARGHQAEIVQFPLRWQDKAGLMKGYLAWRLLDLSMIEGQTVDLLIATKFPSFVIRHHNKVTWLIQQFRQVYDLYGSEYSPYGHQPEDRGFQRIVQAADTRTLAESQRLFAISKNVVERLRQNNGLQAEVLYPPTPHDGRLYHKEYGDYVLVVSRLNVMKRVDMLIRAMAEVRSGVRCVIAGTGHEEAALRNLIKKTRTSGKVKLLGYVADKELLALYASAMAVFYAPYDEDYGFATVEAFKAEKPVLTASDSGGVLEFVEEGITGYVVSPDEPVQLAARIDQLYRDRALCRRLGSAGFDKVRPITWDATIPRLLGA
jgi:glycosyltransferase involved in cell wall biosynthesis